MQFSKDYGLSTGLTPALTWFWKCGYKKLLEIYSYKKPLQFISFSNCWPENLTILNLLNTPYETVILNSASQAKPQEAKGGKMKSFTLGDVHSPPWHTVMKTHENCMAVLSAGGQVASIWQRERKSLLELMCNQEVRGPGTGQERGGNQMGKGSREQALFPATLCISWSTANTSYWASFSPDRFSL